MRRAPRSALIWALALVVGLAAATCAGAPPLTPWSPGESFAGGKQADPRLDRPVQFWGAGAALPDLFAALTRQTGVALGFYPEDDGNRRLHLNVFLNKDQPPPLRDLMVQLSWVMDCPFSVSDEGGQKAYRLLSTSVARGAEKGLLARAQGERGAGEDASTARHQAIDAKLAEYQQAITLPRADLIGKYRGVDDLLLLNLLDEKRRAAVRFMCRNHATVPISRYPQDNERRGEGVPHASPTFTPEDIADLQTAFGFTIDELSNVFVNINTMGDWGGLSLLAFAIDPNAPPRADGEPELREAGQIGLASLTGGSGWGDEERLALHRALGETIAPAEEARFLAKVRQEEAVREQQRRDDAFVARFPLSAEMRSLLSSAKLTFRPGASYAPWQIEEMLAKATGCHVVADAFMARPLRPRAVTPGEVGERTAFTMAKVLTEETVSSDIGLRVPSLEGGAAGRFLRFRNANRDVFRAALLPQSYLNWVDSLLAPYLPKPGEPTRRMECTLTIDPVTWAQQHAPLTDLQVKLGQEICYGDPHELKVAARQAALPPFLLTTRDLSGVLRFVASLTQEQWAKLRSTGLIFPTDTAPASDVTPDQQKLLLESPGGFEQWQTVLGEVVQAVLKFGPGAPNPSYLGGSLRGLPHSQLSWDLTLMDDDGVTQVRNGVADGVVRGVAPERMTVRAEVPEALAGAYGQRP